MSRWEVTTRVGIKTSQVVVADSEEEAKDQAATESAYDGAAFGEVFKVVVDDAVRILDDDDVDPWDDEDDDFFADAETEEIVRGYQEIRTPEPYQEVTMGFGMTQILPAPPPTYNPIS